jgi:hypothetical protein
LPCVSTSAWQRKGNGHTLIAGRFTVGTLGPVCRAPYSHARQTFLKKQKKVRAIHNISSVMLSVGKFPHTFAIFELNFTRKYSSPSIFLSAKISGRAHKPTNRPPIRPTRLSQLGSALCGMSRTKTAYGRIGVCGVVVEEASREVEVTSSNHGNCGASRLYAKKCATCDLMTGTGGWLVGGVSPIRKSFFCLFSVFKC